jgi:hypothetical protein
MNSDASRPPGGARGLVFGPVWASDNLGGRLRGGVRWPRWGLLGASRGGYCSLGFSDRVSPLRGRGPLELG